MTGETQAKGWFEWMLWQEANPKILPHPSYYTLKRDLFLSIDRTFEVFLQPEYLTREAAQGRRAGRPDGERAPRIAGRLSYWFAWNGYLGGAATLYDE